ncbi:MAG TPA: Flp pilus assembly complex ATPase component TadA [Candidatus Faecimonas gallistercoris]|nr:Flp pilus assembly complex ATPase component TadA [Candidatus Faecimonas gallistercoris]
MIKFDFTKTPITQIADYIIISAAKSGASDIHFDPREDGMMVRFRIDGDLQNFTYIPKTYERNLTTRLKLLANMNITESRLPQDGAIKGNFGGTYLDMRVSCLPLNEGEKIVIRILDYSRSLQGLDSLGFNESNLARLKRMIQVPNGIILITGATGSGKSTTVYSVLQTLNKEETNIITVEDPIEMNIEGMNQVQVNAEIGMTFAAALRSILRQDPNVILIGEIRDSETAQIAVRAAITGHLVLSTIHTNNTLSTVERLLDMNVERYLLSTALTGIISQRLAKKICTKCRVKRRTTKFEKKVFKKYLKKDIDRVWDANHDGCDACRKGYKGRVAIQEVLELDDEMRNALNNENISKDELSKLVYSDKVITMLQDALGKVVDGSTSFEEVLRVIEIEDAEDFFENDVAEKIKAKEKAKEEQEKLEEMKEQEENAQQELEIVPLNKATPTNIPTTIQNESTQPTMKTTTTDKPINTLEKINTVENQKNTPEITSAIKQEQQPTPFSNPTITKIDTSQPSIIPIISTTKKPATEQTQSPVNQKKQATSIIPTIINKAEQQPATEQMVSQAISVLPSQ